MMVVLCGDSGTGKTHIAVEYAHHYHKENRGAKVHWVNANSAEQFEFSYRRIAETLYLIRGINEKVSVLETVQSHLKQYSAGRWLMVLDGLDNKERLRATEAIYKDKSLLDFVPSGISARVLFTTRSKSLAQSLVKKKLKNVINTNPFNHEDASILLLGKVTSNLSRKKWVDIVSKELKGSAGAMTLAFTYMKNAEKECNLKEYMKQISTQPETNSGANSGVRNAWMLLHGRLMEKRPHTVDFMLQICALDVQFVPDILFKRSERSENVPILQDYEIVEPSQDLPILCVTALFRHCAQEWLMDHKEEKSHIESMLLSLVCDKFTKDVTEILLPCALAVLNFEPASVQAKRDMATLLFKVALYHSQIGQHKRALESLNKCLALHEGDIEAENHVKLINETKQAIKHIKTLQSQPSTTPKEFTIDLRGTSAVLASREFQKLDQEDVEWRNLDTVRQASHLSALQLLQPETAGSRNAIKLYQRVLGWHKCTNEANKLETARHQYNLALAYDSDGQSKEAEELYRSALSMLQEQFQMEKPDIMLLALHVKILDSLACMYCRQRRPDEAEAAFQVVFPAKCNLLGIDHPETLMTRHNMALLVQERGNLDAAAAELHEVLMAQARLLERFDPATLRTVCSIALNYRLRGNRKEARSLYVALLKLQTDVLGKRHRDTMATKLMLDELLQVGKGKTSKVQG